jgi:hypothetical protein
MKKTIIISFFISLAMIFAILSCNKEEEVPEASVVAKFSATSNNDFTAPSQVYLYRRIRYSNNRRNANLRMGFW